MGEWVVATSRGMQAVPPWLSLASECRVTCVGQWRFMVVSRSWSLEGVGGGSTYWAAIRVLTVVNGME